MWQACFVISSEYVNAYCAHRARFKNKKKKRKKKILPFIPSTANAHQALSRNEKHVSMCKTPGHEIRFTSLGSSASTALACGLVLSNTVVVFMLRLGSVRRISHFKHPLRPPSRFNMCSDAVFMLPVFLSTTCVTCTVQAVSCQDHLFFWRWGGPRGAFIFS